MHVAPAVAPVTVNTAGVDMDAFCGELPTVPEVQVSATGTVAPAAMHLFKRGAANPSEQLDLLLLA